MRRITPWLDLAGLAALVVASASMEERALPSLAVAARERRGTGASAPAALSGRYGANRPSQVHPDRDFGVYVVR